MASFKSRLLFADSAPGFYRLQDKAREHIAKDLKNKEAFLKSYIGAKCKLRIETQHETNCPHLEGTLLCETWNSGVAKNLEEFKRMISKEFAPSSWDCRLENIKDKPDEASDGHYRTITAKISVYPSSQYWEQIEKRYS